VSSVTSLFAHWHESPFDMMSSLYSLRCLSYKHGTNCKSSKLEQNDQLVIDDIQSGRAR
jgi:hypothetical protein